MKRWHDYPAESGMILQFNPSGYKANINHPQVRPLYDRFKKWKQIPECCPLSDAERAEFEGWILKGEEHEKR